MLQKRLAPSLDGGDFGWLKARHHFIVSEGGNSANHPLGPLVVWNDDEIAPGEGFGLHRHQDMEIVSYVRTGAVTHRDSIGNVGSTVAGDVQVMSAGSGIRHSEHNLGQEPLRLFQIWIKPRKVGIEPRWATRKFPKADRANQLVILASGRSSDTEALPIEANARVMGSTLLAGETLEHELGDFCHAYLAPAYGAVEVNGERIQQGDGVAITDEDHLTIKALEDSELILVTAA
jgi:redox-sensitive bicupin YhaK (pirin superfamily)